MSDSEYCPCGYWAALEILPGSDGKHWFLYCRGCETYKPYDRSVGPQCDDEARKTSKLDNRSQS